MKNEQKKQYTPPTLAEYGKVEDETRGLGGTVWEVYGTRPPSDGDPQPPPEYAR